MNKEFGMEWFSRTFGMKMDIVWIGYINGSEDILEWKEIYNGPLECRDKMDLKIVLVNSGSTIFIVWKDAVDLKMFEVLEYSKDTLVLQMIWYGKTVVLQMVWNEGINMCKDSKNGFDCK